MPLIKEFFHTHDSISFGVKIEMQRNRILYSYGLRLRSEVLHRNDILLERPLELITPL